jgi:hypothetical protein
MPILVLLQAYFREMESIMFKITYNIKPAWNGTDAAGNEIRSSASNKLGAKMTATSKDSLIDALEAIDIDQLKNAAEFALRELDDEETSIGLQRHFQVTITIQQPRVEEEPSQTSSRLDPNLIDGDEEASEED